MGIGREVGSAAELQSRIAKGWKPSRYLTNMSMAFFANAGDYVATSIFPICPVDFSTGYYYIYNKGDLARDNVQRKPKFGKAAPAQMGHTDATYRCEVDQVIVGIDQIGAQNYARANVPPSIDPRRAKNRFITDQQLLHLDIQKNDIELRMSGKQVFSCGVRPNRAIREISVYEVLDLFSDDPLIIDNRYIQSLTFRFRKPVICIIS